MECNGCKLKEDCYAVKSGLYCQSCQYKQGELFDSPCEECMYGETCGYVQEKQQ